MHHATDPGSMAKPWDKYAIFPLVSHSIYVPMLLEVSYTLHPSGENTYDSNDECGIF